MEDFKITSDMFDTVDTHALKNGDLVSVSGTLFKLRDRQSRAPRTGESGSMYGDVVWFKTDVALVGNPDGMPAHWRDTWTVQGNKMATWQRVNKSRVRAAMAEASGT